jgi:CHAT domain-containing protein
MKREKTNVIISIFLIVIFITTTFPGRTYGSNLEVVSLYDIWTHIRNLEEKKAFSTLASFLESMVGKMTIQEEKQTFQPDGINTEKITDLEGMAYLLDDLSEIYATGIINFQKALGLNKMAFQVYEKIKVIGLKNISVSEYFNPRRMLYYYFYPLSEKFGSKKFREMEKGWPERYFYNKPEFATFFPEDFLNAVREKDLEELRKRIENRKYYLNQKLGQSGNAKAIISADNYEDLKIIHQLLEKENIYNDYYRNFYIASKLWSIRTKGGEIDYSKLKTLCQEALRVEKEQRLKEDKDSYNLFKYWLGISYLNLGDSKEGTYYIKSFFKGIDEVDDLEDGTAKRRREVMGKAVDEARKPWETISVILGVAGIVGSFVVSIQGMIAAQSAAMGSEGVYYSWQSLMAAERAAQQSALNILQQSLVTSMALGVSSQALSRFTSSITDIQSVRDTKRLSGLVSPLILKVGRYLDKFEQVELYKKLGEGYEKLGQNAKAIRFYREALSLIELQRSTISTEKQRMSFFAVKEGLYKDIVRLLILEEHIEEAFEYVERAKARTFLDILGSKGSIALKNPEETAAFCVEMTRKEEISALLDQTKLGIEQIRSVIIREKSALAPSHLDFEYLTQVTTLTTQEAISLTKDNFSILEYFSDEKTLYIFLFDNGKLFVKGVPIDEKELFNLISSFRKGLSLRKKDLKDIEDSSKSLYRLLIEPIKGMITGKRLIIVPQSWLYYIPFQALKGNGKYLIEEFSITYSPSATIFKLSIEKSRANKDSALILANPYLSIPSSDLYNLAYAEDEASAIVNNFRNSILFVRKEATKTNFKENASKFDVIHIAAHAFFDRENPLNSTIFLAEDQKNDGRLTVAEVFQVDLNAFLAVLSACETGLTYVSRGDELIGFIRALMYSGANSILSTLWNVDDKSTAYLMKIFYDNLRSLPKDIAFQKAQIETMKTFPHPYNWSAFILMGNNY